MQTGSPNLALSFTQLLVDGRFEAAHKMLTRSLQEEISPRDLKSEYEQMISYWTAPVDRVTLADEPEEPGHEDSDTGWAYVAIYSTTATAGVDQEGVIARVITVPDGDRIARIVWGRP